MQDIYHIPAPDMDDKQIALVRTDGLNVINLTLPPITRKTTLEGLTDGLSGQITDLTPILLGFCYGGILAQEVAKRIPQAQVIVVSSIINGNEIQTAQRLLAKFFYFCPNRLLAFLGTAAKVLINDLLRLPMKIPKIWLKADQNKFIVKHSLSFRGPKNPRVFRIHGAKDRIVPIAFESADRIIKSAGHFMFFQNRHKEVLSAIKEAASQLRKLQSR